MAPILVRLVVLLIASALPLLLILVHTRQADAATSGPVLVVVAHPDDEGLAMSGVIANARAAGRRVYVAITTNGDRGGAGTSATSYCGTATGAPAGAAAFGLKRDGESIAALNLLGLNFSTNENSSDIFFLGYPDAVTTDVASATSSITTDATGLHRTYARTSTGSSTDTCNGDLGYLVSGTHSPLTGAGMATDFDRLLAITQPTDVYTHGTFEGHADHREVARQIQAAVVRSGRNVLVHSTLIHPEATDTCSTLSSFQWPNPAGSATANPVLRFTPTQLFTAPPSPTCSATPTSTSWGTPGTPSEQITVPSSMQTTSESTNLKWKVISQYQTQLNCTQNTAGQYEFGCGYLRAFVKKDEIFWTQQFGTAPTQDYKTVVNGTSGLSGYWRFGESSGTNAAAAKGSFAGTHSGVTVGQSGLLARDFDKAVVYSGNASTSMGDHYDFTGTSPFTLEAWVKPSIVDDTSRRIFSKESSDGNNGYYLISNNKELGFGRISNGNYEVLHAPPLTAGKAYHVVFTYDGTRIRIYVNGTETAMGTASGSAVDNTSNFTVGAKATGGGNWDGTIDEPAVYTTALSPATIYAHYQAGKVGVPDTTPPAKPAAPTGVSLNGGAKLNLSPLNSEPDIASYTLQRKFSFSSTYSTVKTGITAFPVTDTGLANGIAYDYRVIAVDTSNNSSTASDPVRVTPAVDTTPPAKPATPTAAAGDGAATINLAPLNADADLASYTLQRKLTSAADSTYVSVKTGITTWPQTDSGLINGTSYSYRVIAVDDAGNSSTASAAVAVTPVSAIPPTYLDTVNGTAGLLGWWRFDDATGTTAAAKRGLVTGTYAAGTSLGQLSLLNGDNNPSVAFNGDTKVTFGDAFDFAGNAPFSLEAWVKPTTLDATSRRIFSKETSDALGVQGYYLFASSTRVSFGLLRNDNYETLTGPAMTVGTRYHVVVTYTGSAMSLYINGTLVDTTPTTNSLPDTSAPFTIGAKATGGGEWAGQIDEPAVYSVALSPATISQHYTVGTTGAAPTDTTPPAKPATPTAAAGNAQASIGLSPLNTDPDLASYTLQRKLTSAADSTYAPVKTGVTAFPAIDTGLVNGTSYSYRVVAVDASGNASTPSDAVAVTPVAPDTTAPAKPATPTASPGNGQAQINLSPLNGESDLASYTLQRKLTSAADSTYAAVKTGVTTWPQTDTGLTNGTSYSYRVVAVDTSGNPSTPSDSVVVVPVAPTYVAAVDATSGLTGYWRFAETSGSSAFAHTGIVNGTYAAGTTLGQPGLLTGDANTAVGFNGDTKVTFGDAFDFAGSAAFSFEAWVKPTTVDATARRIFSKETSDANGAQGYYLISTSTRVSFARLRDDNYETLTGPAMTAGSRYHVVVTFDGTWMRLYINGVQVDASNETTNALLDTAAPFTVGAKASGGGEWAGTIDEPAVYRSAMSADTISQHYLAGL